MKDIKDYIGKKYAIHCKTQEEWDFITKILGYKWKTGNWNRFRTETYISSIEPIYQVTSDEYWSNAKFIEASEFIQPQSEVGKWYKWKFGYGYTLAKFQKITSEGLWNCSEWISKEGEHFRNGSHNMGFVEDNTRILCSKEDLIKYLPKHHPDYPKDELDSLLEEARQKFPIGSTVQSLVTYIEEQIIDSFKPINLEQTIQEIWFKGGEYNILVYKKGKWATLIKNNNLTTKTNNQNDTSKTESCKVQRPNLSISTAVAGGGERFTSTKNKIKFGSDNSYN